MAKFSEDLHDAQGNYVKTVEWAKIAPCQVSKTHSQYTYDYNSGFEYRSETRILLTGTNVEALILAEHPDARIHKIHWDGCAWANQEPQPGPVMHPPTFPIDREYARQYDAWVARRRAQGFPLR